MRLLIDTHVLVWLVAGPSRLSRRVRDLLGDEDNLIPVSAVSAWEIANKVRLGKMIFPASFLDTFDLHVRALGFEQLAVDSRHAVTGARLPGPHRDPFDRLLAGQSVVEGAGLITRDNQMPSLGVSVIW